MAHLTINYRSRALGMPVMLDALIPQGRGGYKTLYLLHGAGGDYASWTLNTRIADYVNNKNIAVIMPSGNNKFYVNNRYGKDYYTFITKELIEVTSNWFSVSDKPCDRYIAGMSMGGYGAMYAALNNPDLYNTAFSYSGLLNILERYDNPQGIDMYPVFGTRQELIDNKLDLYDVAALDSNINADKKAGCKYVLMCGDMDDRKHMSSEFNDRLLTLGYDSIYKESAGEHNWEYWDYCIHQTIKYINEEEL